MKISSKETEALSKLFNIHSDGKELLHRMLRSLASYSGKGVIEELKVG